MGIFSRTAPPAQRLEPQDAAAPSPSTAETIDQRLAAQRRIQQQAKARLGAEPPVAPSSRGPATVPAEAPADGAAARLAALSFSDLMLWPDGRGMLRHAAGHVGPVIEVPPPFRDDVRRIWTEIRREARGREFFLSHDGVPYRVARIDTVNGAGYFLRRPTFPVPALDTLGLPPAMVAALRAIGTQSGMVLMAGATGSGKSTTIYSFLTDVVSRQGDIAVAVEDPPELPAQGFYGEGGKGLWYQIDANAVGGFETAMIAAMRYNPRYLLLGEIRAPKVANEAIHAAVNGHLVLTTIHGSSLSGAILALQQIAAAGAGSLELARSILADGLAAVIHQRLAPDPQRPGQRVLQAEMLCIGNDMGLRAKIRAGKLEQLNTDIDAQALRIARGQSPMEM